jgi:GINS complex subunit 3
MDAGAGDYYSIDEIVAEETTAPCRLIHGCTGVGTVIDPSSDAADLLPGVKLDLPLWMIGAMAGRNMVRAELPVYYGSKMRRKLKAGPGCEDLRVRCPHWYTAAGKIHAAMAATGSADEAFPAFVLSSFAGRYRELLTRAPALEGPVETSQVQSKLTLEELDLFMSASESALAHERWRSNRPSTTALAKVQGLKRKWLDQQLQENNSGAANRQRAGS